MAERKGNIGARENKALAQTKGERTKMQNKAAFGSRIREYRIKKGLSQPQLAALLGVTKNAVTNWEAGASRPDIASIPALCTHLGISADTFFDMPAQYRALNAAEAAHMERYRLLDRYRQRSVDALMDALIENEMLAFREQCVSAFTRIGRDELPASAGTGTPLDDTYEREYVFLRNSRSVCRADTIITVTGDSMLPTFRDGDELLVEYTPEIREGEIGIFVVAGEGFVKEYRSDGLHSHNPKYKTIRPMQDDNFRCVGRVLGAVTEDMLATPQELAVLSEVYSSRQDSRAKCRLIRRISFAPVYFLIPLGGDRVVKAPKPVKVYVGVDVAFDDSGRMRPRVIHWEDGSRYKIDRVLDVRPAPAARAGGQGDRYRIRLLGKETCWETYIFFEHNADCSSQIPGRWFVERKEE